MPTYSFRLPYYNSTNGTLTGYVDADNLREAREAVEEGDYYDECYNDNEMQDYTYHHDELELEIDGDDSESYDEYGDEYDEDNNNDGDEDDCEDNSDEEAVNSFYLKEVNFL